MEKWLNKSSIWKHRTFGTKNEAALSLLIWNDLQVEKSKVQDAVCAVYYYLYGGKKSNSMQKHEISPEEHRIN